MNVSKNPTISSNSRQISETLSNTNKYSSRISKSKYLPPEIWTNILLKLPAKTLVKFKCVCKVWCSIIDQPDFVNMHLKLCNNNKLFVALEGFGCPNPNHGFYWLTVSEAHSYETTRRICIRPDGYPYNFVGSCNGLLLVYRVCGPFYTEELRLWNPSICRSFILPAIPLPPRYSISTARYLVGFAPESKDYKVVAFTFGKTQGIESREMMFTAVYTLGDQQWTVRNNQFDITLLKIIIRGACWPFRHSLSTAVFFQGAAYWLGQNGSESQTSELTHLCSFDFEKENITVLELPFSLNETGFLRFPFLLGESLAIFSISKVASSIWVLEQDNGKRPWTLWFSGQSSLGGYAAFEVCNRENQKVFYCESNGGNFVCGGKAYNIASCQVQNLKRSFCHCVHLEMHSENLVLSKGYAARDLR